jgi:integrase
MPYKSNALTAAVVKNAKPGRYGDGNGLYLFVRSPQARFWLFRYTMPGSKMREMGLGRAGAGAADVTLAEARARAAALFKLVRAGTDPLIQREADNAAAKATAQDVAARAVTFRTVADRYLTAHHPSWRNAKHRQQWTNTLATYAYPHMGDLPVGAVATAHVLAALEPIWTTKPETAARLRGRIEAVLDYAKATDLRHGENPARWKGHLSQTLPARGKVAPVEHHAALPWKDVGAFLVALRGQAGIAARALEFTVLTAARTGEVLGARWSEMDLEAKLWTVPALRMKAGREHRIPLSKPALLVLDAMAKLRTNDGPGTVVFPGGRDGMALSIMAMTMVLRRMKRGDLTVHGFRSTFRDWTAETTAYPREVAEAALAHTLGDKVEAAYRRGDLFNKRRHLMDDWAAFCAEPAKHVGDKIAPLHALQV